MSPRKRSGKQKRLYSNAKSKQGSGLVQYWRKKQDEKKKAVKAVVQPDVQEDVTSEDGDPAVNEVIVQNTDFEFPPRIADATNTFHNGSTENTNIPTSSCNDRVPLTNHDHGYASKKANTENIPVEEDSLPNLIVEPETNAIDVLTPSENRIVDIVFMEKQLAEINRHEGSTFECGFSEMTLDHEIAEGFAWTRVYICQMCKIKKKLYSHQFLKDRIKHMNVNEAAVAGTIIAGVGATTMNKIISAMNIPPMTNYTYAKCHEKVSLNIDELAWEDMRKSAEKAAQVARDKGSTTPDGIPLVPVVCDGAWPKRSYKNNYNSLSGMGVIVAADTHEVLYVGVRNKFCIICTKAQNAGHPPPQHRCFKNWSENQSSGSMEADAIVAGFCNSLAMYGIIYHEMVADGDSSVYHEVLKANPYDNVTVKKIECKNHLLRNWGNHVKADCQEFPANRNTEICRLKTLVIDHVAKMRSSIEAAIKYRSTETDNALENSKNLVKDITNVPSHVFGEHLRCAELQYFCDGNLKPNQENIVPKLQQHGLYQLILKRCSDLSAYSGHLISNKTNNDAESFNAIVCSKIAGKRVNFTSRGGYNTRVNCAVSTKAHGEVFRNLHKKITNRSPGLQAKKYEQSLLIRRKREQVVKARRCLFKVPRKRFEKSVNDGGYGRNARAPDLPLREYKEKEQIYVEMMKERLEQRDRIQSQTLDQSHSGEWHQLRRSLITASCAGRICTLRPETNTASCIMEKFSPPKSNEAMRRGLDLEPVVKDTLREHWGFDIQDSGLIIHPIHYFIGASPDGLVGEDGLVEIKCPFNIKDQSISDALEKNKKKVVYLNDDGTLKKNHKYYFQVQCQLEVTQRQFAYFVLYTEVDLRVEVIERDENFWKTKMFPRMNQFFHNCLLPELVDPRLRRSLPLRDLTYEGKNPKDVRLEKEMAKAASKEEKVIEKERKKMEKTRLKEQNTSKRRNTITKPLIKRPKAN